MGGGAHAPASAASLSQGSPGPRSRRRSTDAAEQEVTPPSLSAWEVIDGHLNGDSTEGTEGEARPAQGLGGMEEDASGPASASDPASAAAAAACPVLTLSGGGSVGGAEGGTDEGQPAPDAAVGEEGAHPAGAPAQSPALGMEAKAQPEVEAQAAPSLTAEVEGLLVPPVPLAAEVLAKEGNQGQEPQQRRQEQEQQRKEHEKELQGLVGRLQRELRQQVIQMQGCAGVPAVLLFFGPAGSGKTTAAHALASACNFTCMASPPHVHSSAASSLTRAHGIAFVDAITVALDAPAHPSLPQQPQLVLLDTPGVLPSSSSCPSPSPCSRGTAIGSSLGGAADDPWAQEQAQQRLAQWLSHGAVRGDPVLLSPDPPLAHLLTSGHPGDAPSKWAPHGALLVLAADNLLRSLTAETAKGSSRTPGGREGGRRVEGAWEELDKLLGVALVWSRGVMPPVLLSRMRSLSAQQRRLLEAHMEARFGLSPGEGLFELPATAHGEGPLASLQTSAAVLKAALAALQRGPSTTRAGTGASKPEATSAPPLGPVCPWFSLWPRIKSFLGQHVPLPRSAPLAWLRPAAAPEAPQHRITAVVRHLETKEAAITCVAVCFALALLVGWAVLLLADWGKMGQPSEHHRQHYYYRSKIDL